MAQLTNERRPLLPLILLHYVAAAICFLVLTVVPIGGCLMVMAIGNDPGGPMFFVAVVIGTLLFAVFTTPCVAGAALLSDLVRRRYQVSLWWPPPIVFGLASLSSWLFFSADVHVAFSLIVGGMVTAAFIIYWAAISMDWFVPRLLFKHLGIQPEEASG